MNSDLLSFGELSHSIQAHLISFSEDSFFSSVAIDSRAVKAGGLFFALNGKTSDGHSFVSDAFNAGARAAVVEDSKIENFNLVNIARKAGKKLIIVRNSLQGLQDSAGVYLKKLPNLFKIGITGSSGKTTTKEIAAVIISCEKNTVKNSGNLNSETGLPLSIFEARQHHEAGIFELGMNAKGEINKITEVLKPNIALITNIGHSHIGNIGSQHDILYEKKSIFNFMSSNDIALIPKYDKFSAELAKNVKGKIHYYGHDTFEELENVRSLGLNGTEITWAGEKIHFPLPGKHSFEDAIAAIAIAKEMSVSNSAIKKGLELVKPLFGRLEIIKGRTTVIRDCYNANPESMAKSIEFCDDLDWHGRRIYVIGEMLELGKTSTLEHNKLGTILAESKAEKIFLFGTETAAAADFLEFEKKQYFRTNDISELSAVLDSYVQSGDLVLLKGSRGCALERLTGILTEVDYVS
jgi:UDP-N-acetylmuramoyl-tripeptide--D-alanyl-D-alanine ligase